MSLTLLSVDFSLIMFRMIFCKWNIQIHSAFFNAVDKISYQNICYTVLNHLDAALLSYFRSPDTPYLFTPNNILLSRCLKAS